MWYVTKQLHFIWSQLTKFAESYLAVRILLPELVVCFFQRHQHVSQLLSFFYFFCHHHLCDYCPEAILNFHPLGSLFMELPYSNIANVIVNEY